PPRPLAHADQGLGGIRPRPRRRTAGQGGASPQNSRPGRGPRAAASAGGAGARARRSRGRLRGRAPPRGGQTGRHGDASRRRPVGTPAAAALARAPEIAGVGGPRRPGIVHRLDKGTSGLIVLAKTPLAYDALSAALARRSVTRRYVCLARGRVTAASGVIDK